MPRSETLELIIKAKDAASQVFARTNQEVGKLGDRVARGKSALAAFNQHVGRGEGLMRSLKGQVAGLVGAFAGFQAIRKANDIIRDADQALFNLQSSVKAANREFKDVGSIESWEATIRDLSDELKVYSNTALRNAVSRTVDMSKRLGLTEAEMRKVIARSGDLAAGKVELTGAVERVTAALRGEAESAEYLGLTLNETYVQAWYEARGAMQGAWKDLDDLQKAQVRYQVFLAQTAEMQGRAAESLDTYGGALAYLSKEISNAIDRNKDVDAAMADFAATIRENSEEIGDLVAQLTSFAAKIVEMGLKYKDFLLVFAGTAVATAAVGKLVNVIRGLNAAFTVLTGTSVIAWFRNLAGAMSAVIAAGGAAAAVMTGGLAAAAALSVVQIGRVIKAFWELRDIQKEIKGIKADEDWLVSEKAAPKLKALSDSLGITITSLDEFNRLVEEGKIVFDEAAGAWVNAEEEKQAAIKETQQVSKDALTEFETLAEKAYDKALSKAKEYGREAGRWSKEIAQYQRDTAEAVSEMEKKGLSDFETYFREKKEMEEVLSKARTSAAQEDYEAARDYYDRYEDLVKKNADAVTASKSEIQAYLDELKRQYDETLSRRDYDAVKEIADQYNRLTEMLKTAGQEGEKVIVKPFEAAKKEAVAALESIRDEVVKNVMEPQREAAQKSADAWEETAERVKKVLEEIKRQAEEGVEVTFRVEQVDELSARFNEVIAAAEAPEVPVKADTAEAASDVEDLRRDIESGRAAKIGVEADSADISRAERDIKSLTGNQGDAEIAVTLSGVDAARRVLDELTKTETKLIKVISKGAETEGYAAGGRVGGGWGGGDRIPAMLEPGEFVLRKEAVSRYGAQLLHSMNSLSARVNLVPRFAKGGLAGWKRKIELAMNPYAAYREGGEVMHALAPGFHGRIAGTLSAMTPMGQAFGSRMVGAFSSAIAHLQTGGGITRGLAALDGQAAIIREEYTRKIEAARAAGDEEIAVLLERERIELARLKNELEFTLRELKAEYEARMMESRARQGEDQEQARLDLRETLGNLRREKAEAEDTYETRRAELKAEVQEAEASLSKAMLRSSGNISPGRPGGVRMALSGFGTPASVGAEARAEIESAKAELVAAKAEWERRQEEIAAQKSMAVEAHEAQRAAASRESWREQKTAEEEFERAAKRARKEYGLDAREVRNETRERVHEVRRSVEKEIESLEKELRDALADLRGRAQGEVQMAGVRHFLKEGGPVGYPEGAKRGVDSVLSALAPGEYVMKESVVRRMGKPFFDALNNLSLPRLPRFQEGGFVPGGMEFSDITGRATREMILRIKSETEEARVRGEEAEIRRLIGMLRRLGLSTV